MRPIFSHKNCIVRGHDWHMKEWREGFHVVKAGWECRNCRKRIAFDQLTTDSKPSRWLDLKERET